MVVDAGDPDPGPEGIAVLSCPTLMRDAATREALAREVLGFAETLR
jgi:hypothetical protein